MGVFGTASIHAPAILFSRDHSSHPWTVQHHVFPYDGFGRSNESIVVIQRRFY